MPNLSSMSTMSRPAETSPDLRDQAEYMGVLGLAPAETVTAFAADIAPELGPVDVVSVQAGLLRFDTTAEGGTKVAAFTGQDVLVTEAHVLLADSTDGYGAVFGSDAEHAIAAAILDAALHAEARTEAFRALQRRIQAFIDAQAAQLSEADDLTGEQADGQAFPQADLLSV